VSERGDGGHGEVRFGHRYYEQQIAIPAELATLSKAAQEHVESLRTERDLYKKEARTDPLTDLPNRKALSEWVEPVIEARLRQRQGVEQRQGATGSLFIGVVDLDHFKKINDGPGHDVGDSVLVWLAAQMHSSISDRDIVARVGGGGCGEEFVVGLNGVDRETALERLDDLRAQIESASQPKLAEWGITDREALTASIGLAEFDGSCTSYNDVFLRADAALYSAKEERNQVAAFNPNNPDMASKVREP